MSCSDSRSSLINLLELCWCHLTIELVFKQADAADTLCSIICKHVVSRTIQDCAADLCSFAGETYKLVVHIVGPCTDRFK